MAMASGVHEMVRLNRHSFLPGPPEQILINTAPQDKYPTEVFVFERLHKPLADRFVETPPPAPTVNGQLIDTATHLMCSKCGGWQPDEAFRMDTHRGGIRRGRRYYCRHCLSKNPIYLMGDAEALPVVRGRPRKTRH